MQCRRCKQTYTTEDDEIGTDTPGALLYRFAIGHPTVICLGCFDDWYITFAEDLKKYHAKNEYLQAQLQGRIIIGHASELFELTKEVNELMVRLNIASIVWVRKGSPHVLSDGE